MKNVIVFTHGDARFAIELRWVREVFTLGYVTPVPRAPAAVAGVVNYRGSIVPVLDLDALLGWRGAGAGGPAALPPAQAGQGAILVEFEDLRAALRLSSVVEVSTLRPADDAAPDILRDSTGHVVPLVEPAELLTRARSAATAAATSPAEPDPSTPGSRSP